MSTLQIQFPSDSPFNAKRMGGQLLRLYDYLKDGKSIHCFHPAKRDLRIGYLNSRISDLSNKFHVPIKKERIKVPDVSGEMVEVIQYSME